MLLIIIGFLAGMVSGMGIGGGAVLIPSLYFFYHPEQHTAQSVNLLFFIPTAIAALIVHIRRKKIRFRTALPIAACGFLGSWIGTGIALSLSSSSLKRCFGAFLFFMGVCEFFRKGKKREDT